jgi:predicted DNA-binding ribbon-helix-helix protein
MEFHAFAFWLLCSLLGVLCAGLGWFFTALISEIKGMREEMSNLNSKLAVVVANQDWHGKELLRLEKRVETIEQTKPH